MEKSLIDLRMKLQDCNRRESFSLEDTFGATAERNDFFFESIALYHSSKVYLSILSFFSLQLLTFFKQLLQKNTINIIPNLEKKQTAPIPHARYHHLCYTCHTTRVLHSLATELFTTATYLINYKKQEFYEIGPIDNVVLSGVDY